MLPSRRRRLGPMIVLENRTRTQKTFNLTHRIAPLRRVHKRAVRDREGVTRVHDHRMVYPDSITILAGKQSPPVPDIYVTAPEIAKAIVAGDIVVREVEPAKPSGDAPVTEEATEETAPTFGRRRPRG